MKSFVSWCGQFLAWLVTLTLTAMIAAAVLVPRLAGATPYTILTGSMRPSMPPGTLVVVKPRPADEISVGDVVTYQLESGKPTVVTHRVKRTSVNMQGQTVFTTQGDTNKVADAKTVTYEQIRGVRWYSVPQLGRASNLLTGSQRQTATTLLVCGLFGYAGWMLLGSARERNGKKNTNKHKHTAEEGEST